MANREGKLSPGVEGYFAKNIEMREIVEPFRDYFDITYALTSYDFNTTVEFVFLKPHDLIERRFGINREVALAFCPYAELQPRVFQSIRKFLSTTPAQGRVDPLLYFLVSKANNQKEAVEQQLIDMSQSGLVIQFDYKTCISSSDSKAVIDSLENQLFSRDLYDIEDPIDDDLLFFGRKALIFELLDALKRAQNIGLFGLRKMGKTSVIFKLRRLFRDEGIGDFIYFNLEKPTLYAREWFSLLGEIRNRLPTVKQARQVWDETKAVREFERAVREYRRLFPGKRLVIALDEIEHIVPQQSLRAHWDHQFLDFWKAARAIQNQERHLSFILVGANASALETPMYNGVDNPLFSWAKGIYIPTFDIDEITQMTRTLGRYSGVSWSREALSYLFSHYGGHPLLTRLACSKLMDFIPPHAERPFLVSEKLLLETEEARDNANFEFAQHVLGMLQKWYPREADMLRDLASAGPEMMAVFEKSRPDHVRHLVAYGLISGDPRRISMPFLIKFLKSGIPFEPGVARNLEAIDDEDHWATISELRNRLEPKIRRLIKRVLTQKAGFERWIDPVLGALPKERREKLSGVDRDEILQRRLFLGDLLNVILINWGDFEFLSRGLPEAAVERNAFDILMKFINTHREDAHAKATTTSTVAAVRLAVKAIETCVDRFLVD